MKIELRGTEEQFRRLAEILDETKIFHLRYIAEEIEDMLMPDTNPELCYVDLADVEVGRL